MGGGGGDTEYNQLSSQNNSYLATNNIMTKRMVNNWITEYIGLEIDKVTTSTVLYKKFLSANFCQKLPNKKKFGFNTQSLEMVPNLYG